MQDRFAKLRDRLEQTNKTHVSLVIEVRDGERHHALFRKSLTVRDVREEIVTHLIRETGGEGDYVLTINGVRLSLSQTLEKITTNTVITLQRTDHQTKTTDEVYLLLADNTRQEIDKLPCVIGRSRQADFEGINLIDQPENLTVSRRHAELSHRDGDYYINNITDNPAERPIYLNESEDGSSIVDSAIPKLINDGDIIRLGKVTFTFHVIRAAHAPD